MISLEKYNWYTIQCLKHLENREKDVFIILHPKVYWTYYLEIQLNSQMLFKNQFLLGFPPLQYLWLQLNKAGAARVAASVQWWKQDLLKQVSHK